MITALLWTSMLQGQQGHIAITQSTEKQFTIQLYDHDHLPDSIYNAELTLHIDVPDGWDQHAAVYVGDSLWQIPIITNVSSP